MQLLFATATAGGMTGGCYRALTAKCTACDCLCCVTCMWRCWLAGAWYLLWLAQTLCLLQPWHSTAFTLGSWPYVQHLAAAPSYAAPCTLLCAVMLTLAQLVATVPQAPHGQANKHCLFPLPLKSCAFDPKPRPTAAPDQHLVIFSMPTRHAVFCNSYWATHAVTPVLQMLDLCPGSQEAAAELLLEGC